jgi:phospholipase/lecithinase/hemolysin
MDGWIDWRCPSGPNWIDFLATTYNASFIKTYNLASGGATVDASLVAPYAPTVLSLKDQVAAFTRAYSAHPASAPWKPNDALFAFFIGINDVGNSWWLNNATLYDAIFDVYAAQLGNLYAAGARNLLFLSVPPVERAPLTLSKDDGGYAVENEGRVILDWNRRLKDLTSAFGRAHGDANLFVHDTWSTYDRVLKNPAAFEQTRGLRNTTGFCAAYAGWVSFVQVSDADWLRTVARRRGIPRIRVVCMLSMSIYG